MHAPIVRPTCAGKMLMVGVGNGWFRGGSGWGMSQAGGDLGVGGVDLNRSNAYGNTSHLSQPGENKKVKFKICLLSSPGSFVE